MAKIRIKSVQFYIILGILLVIFLPPFAKYQELRYKNKRLAEKISALKDENKRLEEEKRKLETDIVYIEKKAREKIGVVRKGEIVLKEKEAPKKTKR
jgi:cell division protein FtsB